MTKLLSAFVLIALSASAGPLTFDFIYTGVGSAGAGLTVTGQLQIDSSVLQTILADTLNPTLPMSDLEGFGMTVAGASFGNGTFTSADFIGFSWWSAGASFDLTKNLVGQGPTTEFCPCVLWGEGGPGDLNGGDFNFYNGGISSSPSGFGNFELGTFSGQLATLTFLAEVAVPEPGALSLVLFGGLAMYAISSRRKKPHRATMSRPK